MNRLIHPGVCVQTIDGEQDTGSNGAERHTPPGTWGHISDHNHADHWNLVFPSGARLVVTEAELCDATQYKLDRPQTLEQNALALQYGQTCLGLTILDDWMMPFTQWVAGNPDQILELIKERNKDASRPSEVTPGHDLKERLRLKVFEVTAAGYDAATDETDALVYWVAAISADVVQTAIQDTGATFCGEVSGYVDQIDFVLPEHYLNFTSALLEKASDLRNRSRAVA